MSWTYKNPVWPHYFADPFVLKWRGDYYAYGTSPKLDHDPVTGAAQVFKILRSKDLVRWEHAGSALTLKDTDATRAFWAPEVAEKDGMFYCYYSSAPAGKDELHRLRVAVAEKPTGPFVEHGLVFPEVDEFCIDAHPFRDPADGKWYLYFAKDYFDERTGTGLAVVPLADDMLRASGPPTPVLRANHDWQIYERNRTLYGRKWTAWHTVEGPYIVHHEGHYYCFYSGGNWQTHEYGVSYAVAGHPLGPWVHASEKGPIVLRQKPGEVLGPGHNSYAIAPDGTELLVYHAWDPERTGRRMCLDRLVWTPDGPRCLGPTTTEQTVTNRTTG